MKGGKRPGAGRKPSDVEHYRREMERTLLGCVTPEDWQRVVSRALTQAKQGDAGARQWLSDRVMGKVRDETKVTHEQSGGFRVEVVYADAGPIGPAAPAPGPVADQGAG